MQINGVNDEEKRDYPKMEEVTEEKIKRHIPKKWIALGIGATIIVGGAIWANYLSVDYDLGGVVATMHQRDIFNTRFLSYEGNNKPGSEIKALISAIVSSNYDVQGKDVAIKYNISNIQIDGIADNVIKMEEYTAKSAADFANKANELKAQISTGKRYTVATERDSKTGFVNMVIISEQND